jgi:NAD(P)-dependent dehydrogenase (short-subunit alcohol dehydrogenase family)
MHCYSSGIGRSVAVLMAREGADITIVYLPEEEDDAEDTKKMIEAEKRTCNLFAGNLMDNETCRKAVEAHVQKYIDLMLHGIDGIGVC